MASWPGWRKQSDACWIVPESALASDCRTRRTPDPADKFVSAAAERACASAKERTPIETRSPVGEVVCPNSRLTNPSTNTEASSPQDGQIKLTGCSRISEFTSNSYLAPQE